jgi:hypothetical protein
MGVYKKHKKRNAMLKIYFLDPSDHKLMHENVIGEIVEKRLGNYLD